MYSEFSEPLHHRIHRMISRKGRITFSEYMKEVLYAPGLGYYMRKPKTPHPDYFSSPTVHPAFGAMLACYTYQLWQNMNEGEFDVIEMGAGSGLLAADFMQYIKENMADAFEVIRYSAFDISSERSEYYEVSHPNEAASGTRGCLIANELLDAFPVHLFEIHQGEPYEVFVTEKDGRIVETLDESSTHVIQERLAHVKSHMADGYRGEVCVLLEEWAAQAAEIIKEGYVIIIDYGYPRHVLYGPKRTMGTLRCYSSHTFGIGHLNAIGTQDITAHVDFTALDEAMTAKGFIHDYTMTQSEFMTRLGASGWLEYIRRSDMDADERMSNAAGIRKVMNSAELGMFNVAVYRRNAPFSPSPKAKKHPPPLLKSYPGHLDIPSAWKCF